MFWYLLHTKPRHEQCALDNLTRQGYLCYLPLLPCEKLNQGRLSLHDTPLFPRYLFIQLGHDHTAQSWTPIRSTRGVSRLVTFGSQPARVDDALIARLRAQEFSARHTPRPLFQPGERVRLTQAPFAGIEGIFQIADSDQRVLVLIELLHKPVCLPVAPASLRRVS